MGYVMALKPSHAWWHRVGEIGSLWEAAVAAGYAWEDERHPGDWVKVMRRFRDGHEQQRWDPTVLKESGGRLWLSPMLDWVFSGRGLYLYVH